MTFYDSRQYSVPRDSHIVVTHLPDGKTELVSDAQCVILTAGQTDLLCLALSSPFTNHIASESLIGLLWRAAGLLREWPTDHPFCSAANDLCRSWYRLAEKLP